MMLLVTDSSVFFDMIKIEALSGFFTLDFEICTSDFVQNEILEFDQRQQIEVFVRTKKLTVFELSGDEIDEVIRFKTKRVFKTLIDKTVLWKAKQLECPLLTCDGKLRKEAEEQGVQVHGSLWVIMKMAEQEIVTKKVGVEFLEQLKRINNRIPLQEVDKLIKQLKQ